MKKTTKIRNVLTDEMIAKWGKTNKKYNEALDELYKIACPNKK